LGLGSGRRREFTMEGRRPWQRSARFEQRKKKKSKGRRKEKEEEDAGERERSWQLE